MPTGLLHMLRDQQQRFADCLRDPQQPAPPDLAARRLQIYRELFFNNVNQLLTGMFPVARSVLDEVIAKVTAFPDAVGAGRIKVAGNPLKLGELMMLMDEFPRMFEIVEPKRAPVA